MRASSGAEPLFGEVRTPAEKASYQYDDVRYSPRYSKEDVIYSPRTRAEERERSFAKETSERVFSSGSRDRERAYESPRDRDYVDRDAYAYESRSPRGDVGGIRAGMGNRSASYVSGKAY